MLCHACLDIFRVYRAERGIPVTHQCSAEAVLDSASQGCNICRRLQALLLAYDLRHREDTGRCGPLSTVYIVEPIKDQVKVIYGDDDKTRPHAEELSSSGLEYAVRLGWRGRGPYLDEPSVEYLVIAAKKLPTFLGGDDYVPTHRTDSTASWDLQKRWIKKCVEHHPACRGGPDEWMPSRVLDVGSIGSPEVRLLESRTLPRSRNYITLSHCWGQVEVIKLTTTTIGDLQRGIPVSELPLLYQEVVTACRQLMSPYLWIDSLCIIQDDELDRSREIAAMGQVYSNSFCNIEASQAKDATGHLFFSRAVESLEPLPVTVEWHEDGPLASFMIALSVLRNEDVANAPLQGRAWVLQEHLLTPRSMIFGKSQVHWACRTEEASEMFPQGLPDLRRGSDLLTYSTAPRSLQILKGWIASVDPLLFDHIRLPNQSVVSPQMNLLLAWRSVVLKYTSRALSFQRDKLAAISGLASVIERKAKVPYIAGMWNAPGCFEYELCWTATDQTNGQAPFRPREYRAPTWSWASIEGQVSYRYKRNQRLTGDRKLAFVENVQIETIDGTATGPVKSGLIQIKGPLVEKYPGAFSPDDDRDLSTEPVFYLAMFEQFSCAIWGLALRQLQSGPSKGRYERIGSFHYVDQCLHDELCSAPTRLITII